MNVHTSFQTFLIDIFLDFHTFASDCALVDENIDRSIEKTVGGDFHSVGNEDNITRYDLSTMNLSPLAVPDHLIIVGVFSHLVELIELLLLVIIADSRDYSADDNSEQNGNTIHPEELPLLACEILHHD